MSGFMSSVTKTHNISTKLRFLLHSSTCIILNRFAFPFHDYFIWLSHVPATTFSFACMSKSDFAKIDLKLAIGRNEQKLNGIICCCAIKCCTTIQPTQQKKNAERRIALIHHTNFHSTAANGEKESLSLVDEFSSAVWLFTNFDFNFSALFLFHFTR